MYVDSEGSLIMLSASRSARHPASVLSLHASLVCNYLAARIRMVVLTGFLACGLSSCAPQIPAESNDIPQRSKVVTQDSVGDQRVLQQTSRPWQPDPRYLTPSKGHSAQVIDIFRLNPATDGSLRTISVDRDGKVLLWMLRENVPYELYTLASPGDTYALSADQRLLAVARGTTVSLHSLPEHRQLGALDRLATRVNALTFHPHGGSVLIAGADGKVYRWKYLGNEVVNDPSERNKPFERYLGHATVVSAVAFHPNGRFFLSGDWKGRLRAWLLYDSDLFEGGFDENIFEGKFFTERVPFRVAARSDATSIDFIRVSQDGEFFLLGTGGGNIELWSTRGYKREAVAQAYRGVIKELDFDSASQKVMGYGRDGMLKVWEIVRREDDVLGEVFYELVLTRESRVPSIQELSFLDEKRAVAGGVDGSMMLIQLDKLTEVSKDKGAA